MLQQGNVTCGVQRNNLLCQQFWKQQLPAWRAELFGTFACRFGKHITWKQPASDANFSKNTQNSQCQYLLPNCGAHTFKPYIFFSFHVGKGKNAKPMVSCNIIPGISHAWSYDFLQSDEIPTVFAKTSPRTGSARKNCYSWQQAWIQFLNKLVLARQHRLLQTVLVEKAENKLHNPVSAQGCFKRLPHT